MRTLLLSVLLLFAVPALADDGIAPVGQIALMPPGEIDHPDIEAIIRTHWKDYYRTGAEHSFDRDKVRVGRFDLNGDGLAELIVMIDDADWEAEHGKPLLVADWINKGWRAVGWSWGDDETVFATTEIVAGWRTIDTGTQYLRWDGKLYQRVNKSP